MHEIHTLGAPMVYKRNINETYPTIHVTQTRTMASACLLAYNPPRPPLTCEAPSLWIRLSFVRTPSYSYAHEYMPPVLQYTISKV